MTKAGSGFALEPHSGWEAPPGTGGGKPREGFLRGVRAIPLPAYCKLWAAVGQRVRGACRRTGPQNQCRPQCGRTSRPPPRRYARLGVRRVLLTQIRRHPLQRCVRYCSYVVRGACRRTGPQNQCRPPPAFCRVITKYPASGRRGSGRADKLQLQLVPRTARAPAARHTPSRAWRA